MNIIYGQKTTLDMLMFCEANCACRYIYKSLQYDVTRAIWAKVHEIFNPFMPRVLLMTHEEIDENQIVKRIFDSFSIGLKFNRCFGTIVQYV